MSSDKQITGSIQLWDIQAPITMQPPYPRMWANTRSRFRNAQSDELEHPCTSQGDNRALCLPARSPAVTRKEETRFAQSRRFFKFFFYVDLL